MKGRRQCLIPQELELHRTVSICGCWEPNSSSLQKQQMLLLTAESTLQVTLFIYFLREYLTEPGTHQIGKSIIHRFHFSFASLLGSQAHITTLCVEVPQRPGDSVGSLKLELWDPLERANPLEEQKEQKEPVTQPGPHCCSE